MWDPNFFFDFSNKFFDHLKKVFTEDLQVWKIEKKSKSNDYNFEMCEGKNYMNFLPDWFMNHID